ncbi:hypothetical protein ACHHYP_09189 [Achlya hypogyna]|uniref:Zinc finger PHD-type domain-containing protein n=1 Tax=Achlya hypogyna TaxID=1202772 RepID=A0A1V9ZJF7_ACHHY|nr:hypothetical protein ACHHYP_09189 [Achlya hypogyna]
MSLGTKRGRAGMPADECPKCQFSLFDGAGHCKVCDYINSKQKLRPCVHCEKVNTNAFCDMCGQGYHKKCAEKCGIQIESDEDGDRLVCTSCENDESDWNVGCGGCSEAFANEELGLQVGQLVLVEFEFVLYNAIVQEVNEAEDSVKIHFVRWSKSFDGWYKMDDERVNESLACDSCNQWFHIACLPPIKASGRYKHTSYVCEKCFKDAKTNRKPKASDTPARPRVLESKAVKNDKKQVNDEEEEIDLPELPKRKVGRPSLKQLKHERETIALRKAMLKTIKDKQKVEPTPSRSRRTPTSEQIETKKAASPKETDELEKDDRPTRKRSSPPPAKPPASPAQADPPNQMPVEEAPKKVAKKDDANKPDESAKKPKKKDEPTKAKPEAAKKVDTKRALDVVEKVAPRKRSRSDDRGHGHDVFRPIAPKPKPIVEVSSDSDADDIIEDDTPPATLPSSRRKPKKKNTIIEPEDEDDCGPSPDDVSKTASVVKNGKNSLILLSALLNSPQFDKEMAPPPLTMKKLPSLATVTTSAQDENRNANQSAFDILRVVASQTMHQSPCKKPAVVAPPPPETSLEYDTHFYLREEMYVQVCAMEEAGLIPRDVAGLLRSWTHPTSSRFEDVRFVYLVNKHNSPALLAQRLAEVTRNYG